MNIEEAIAELKYQARKPYSPFQVEVPKAIQLGIDVFSGWKLSRHKFKELWNSLNKGYQWEMNPWVWVYKFDRRR